MEPWTYFPGVHRFVFNRNGTRWASFFTEQTGLAFQIEIGMQALLGDQLNQATAACGQFWLLIGIETSYLWAEEMSKCQAHAFKDATHTLHLNFLFTTHFKALLGDLLT